MCMNLSGVIRYLQPAWVFWRCFQFCSSDFLVETSSMYNCALQVFFFLLLAIELQGYQKFKGTMGTQYLLELMWTVALSY